MHRPVDDNAPCYVVKAPCGHYVGAVTADPEDAQLTAETLKEWVEQGGLIEQKPVSFVRSGGLTFCDCPRASKK